MRAPFQVLIFPYRKCSKGYEVAIFRRSDTNIWQGASGGGEDNETPFESAVRELFEETQLSGDNLVKLDAMCMLPKVYYQDHMLWDKHKYVVPEHSFYCLVSQEPIISHEHVEFKWCSENEAINLLEYDSNKIAVWEIYQRLNNQS